MVNYTWDLIVWGVAHEIELLVGHISQIVGMLSRFFYSGILFKNKCSMSLSNNTQLWNTKMSVLLTVGHFNKC